MLQFIVEVLQKALGVGVAQESRVGWKAGLKALEHVLDLNGPRE
jgi:hypothetical protein